MGPGAFGFQFPFRFPRLLIITSIAMLALRIAWIFLFREIDGDAYGHFFIALAARRNPTHLQVHWVWLPLYHFIVGGLTVIGLTFRGLRIVNALLATVGPFLIYDATKRRVGDEEALASSVALAIAPLTIVLGQSAQPETAFVLFVMLSIFEASRDRFVRAGSFLAVACMLRYEAWGAVIALGVCWLIGTIQRRPRRSSFFAWAAIPSAVVILYVLFRWWTDHELLYFFRGTREITTLQVARHEWTFREIISFPIILPFIIFGPTLLFVPIGAKVAMPEPRDWVMPVGYAAFLLLSYYGGGSHSGERYLVSLVPFTCMAIGVGAVRLGRWIRKPRLIVAIMLATLALTTTWHLRRAASMAIQWDQGLKEREEGLK